jgi:hypothetical protein
VKAKSIIVTGIEYPLWYDADALKATGARGQYLGDSQKILLDTKLPEATLLRTVLHEALHAIFEKSPLCAGPDAGRDVTPELEEKLCQLFERELPELFKANPWLKAVFK